MANCAHCGKVFTCGCQKAHLKSGVVVCKQCKDKAEPPENVSRDLAMRIGRQRMKDMRVKAGKID